LPTRKKIEPKLFKKAEELKEHYMKVKENRNKYLETGDEKYLEDAIKLILANKPQCTISHIARRLYLEPTIIRKLLKKLREEGYLEIIK